MKSKEMKKSQKNEDAIARESQKKEDSPAPNVYPWEFPL